MTEAILLGAAFFSCGMLYLIWKQLEAAKEERANQMTVLHDKIDALSQEVYHIANTVDRTENTPPR